MPSCAAHLHRPIFPQVQIYFQFLKLTFLMTRFVAAESPIPFADDDDEPDEVPGPSKAPEKLSSPPVAEKEAARYQIDDEDDIYEDLIEPAAVVEPLEIFSSAASSQVDLAETDTPAELPPDDVMERLDRDLQRINLLSEEIERAMDQAVVQQQDPPTISEPPPPPTILADEVKVERQNIADEISSPQPQPQERETMARPPPVPMAVEEDDDYNDMEYIDDDVESQQAGSDFDLMMDRPFSADVFERHIQQPVEDQDFRPDGNKEAIAPAVHIISTRLSHIMSKEAALTKSAELPVVAPYEVPP